MDDLVSVVVPTRDRKHRILRTLTTLVAQDYPAIEIVICDDGSVDGTSDFIKEQYGDRVRVVRNDTSQGVSNARNRAIAEATGKWIAVCDDDDYWVSHKIRAQIEYMRKNDGKWSFCQSVMVDDDLNILDTWAGIHQQEKFVARIGYGNTVSGGCSSVIFSRRIFDEVGGFDQTLSTLADWDMWARMTRIEPPTPWPGYGTLYVMHEGQMSLDPTAIIAEADIVRNKNTDFREKYRNPLPLEGIDIFIIRKLMKGGQWRSAIKHTLDSAIHRRGRISLRLSEFYSLRRKNNIDPEAKEAVQSVRGLLKLQKPAKGQQPVT